jgi:hypothetical protein
MDKTLNDLFARQNEHDTSDDEVCIGFDLDAVTGYHPTTAALAAAHLSSRNDVKVRDSLQHALNFEIQRLGGHRRQESFSTPQAIQKFSGVLASPQSG